MSARLGEEPASFCNPPSNTCLHSLPKSSVEMELSKVKESSLFSHTYTPLHSPPLFAHTQPSPGSKEHLQCSKPKMFAGFNSTANDESQQTQSKSVYLSPLWKHDSSVGLIVHSRRSSFSSQRNATPPDHQVFPMDKMPPGSLCLSDSHTHPPHHTEMFPTASPKDNSKVLCLLCKNNSGFLWLWHSRSVGSIWGLYGQSHTQAGSFGSHVLFFCQQEDYWNQHKRKCHIK